MAEKFYSFKSYKSLDVTTLGFMCYSQKFIPFSREIAWIQQQQTVCVNRTVPDFRLRLYDFNYGIQMTDLSQRVEVAEVCPLEAVEVAVASALGQGTAGGRGSEAIG